MTIKLWLPLLSMAGLTLSSAWTLAQIRYNVSPSIPEGFYRVTGNGSIALFCPAGETSALSLERGYRERIDGAQCPDGALPLGKPIVAREGDRVDVSSAGVRVNGKLLPESAPLKSDSHGRHMADHTGQYLVQPGEVWVVSSENKNSFDSRYFGPVRTSDITARMEPLWVW